jgi:hypothetical protein
MEVSRDMSMPARLARRPSGVDDLPSSSSSAMRPKICCSVNTRSERPRPTKLTSQCSSVVRRFLKPMR